MPTPTNITVGNGPAGLALTPDGSELYVANTGDGTVSVIDTATQLVTHTITVGNLPFGLAANPAGGQVMVANLSDNDVSVIDTSTHAVVATISSTINQPIWITYSPDGTLAYVVNSGGTTVTVIDAVSNTFSGLITGTGGTSQTSTISSDGSLLYVGGNHVIAVVDTGSNTVIHTPSISGQAYGIAISSDDSTLYICNGGDSADITTMDTGSFSTGTITVGGSFLYTAVVSADGTTLVVADDGGDSNYLIDLGTTLVTETLVDTDPTPYMALPNADLSIVYVSLLENDFIDVFALATPIALTGTSSVDYDTEDADIDFAVLVPLTGTSSVEYDTEDAEIDFAVLVPIDGTSSIEYDTEDATLIVVITHLTGTSSIEYDTEDADLTLHSIPHKFVTTLVLAGDPGPRGYASVLVPMPPNPVPGPLGNHDYEVLVVDQFGCGYGVIPTAVPTEIDYVLDGIGQALIDFAVNDPQAAYLLPIDTIPAVREVQIWRDQELIFWCLPTSATWDAAQVHLTCQGLLWPLSTREIGPKVFHFVTNTQFEEGLFGWSQTDNVLAYADPGTVVLGKGAARLFCGAPGLDSYLYQDVVVDLTDSPTGFAFALSAYVYVDYTFGYSGNALDNRGLFMSDQDGNFSFVELDDTIPGNTWTRLEVQPSSTDPPAPAFVAPGGAVTTYQIRLYCPGGSVVWDDVVLKVYENVSAAEPSPPATAWDVTDIISALLDTAKNPFYGKSDLWYGYVAAPTGVLLNRVYQLPDSSAFLDLMNEFPTIGVCDFEMAWDETGHFRFLQLFSPAKGEIKYNYPIEVETNTTTDLEGAVDGTQVGTTQRIFGQGSSGPARDTGYAQFASYLGGRVVTDATFTIGDNVVSSATANFSAADVGVNIYSLGGALFPATYIVEILSATEARFNNEALLTLTDDTFGVGGFVIDKSESALPNQPVSTLQQSAQAFLLQQMKAQALPSAKQRADGPHGLFGLVTVGDVVPVSADYGWVQIPNTLYRIAALTLYPPTEELEVTLMQLNTLVSPSS